ncbi:MAG: hypothetical protein ABIM99_01515 [Candidatus Dojkabacteria bacterium]
METPKPDPIIIQPVMPAVQMPSLPPIPLVELSTMDKLKVWIIKNKKLAAVIILFLIVFLTTIILVIISSNRNLSVNPNPTPNVSRPILPISQPITTEPNPTSITTKTVAFSVDNEFGISQKPINTLKGTINVEETVSVTNPTQFSLVIKQGSSSFTITNFYEETQHKFIDANFIGITKTLGETYRVSQVGTSEGSAEYFYVQPDAIKLTGSCNPTSYPDPIAAPCGVSNYKGYYFQCTGNQSFEFCDKIMTNLEFTITDN